MEKQLPCEVSEKYISCDACQYFETDACTYYAKYIIEKDETDQDDGK